MHVFKSAHPTTRTAPDFRKLFETMPGAYLVVSPQSEILAVSDKYLMITENQREQLIGRSLDRDFANDPNRPWIGHVRRLSASLRRVRQTGRPHRIILREKSIDGAGLAGSSRRMWCASSTPIRDASGKLICILHRLRNVGAAHGSRRIPRLERRLIAMQEEDRTRIARELHDQMAQYLTAMMLGLESLKDPDAPRGLEAGIDYLQTIIQDVGQEVHRLTWDLRPAPIEELGFRNSLERCIEELSSHSSLQLYFHSNLAIEDRFDPGIETICYRIIQEGLANIVKHARAKTASVIVTRTRFELQIIVEDDGVGFEVPERVPAMSDHDHIGLRGMGERLALVRGSLQVESTVGRGTSLFARIPLR